MEQKVSFKFNNYEEFKNDIFYWTAFLIHSYFSEKF